MTTTKTITICFKEQPFRQNNFKASNFESNEFNLEYKPLFDINEQNDSGFSTNVATRVSDEENKLYRLHEIEVEMNNLNDITNYLEDNPDIEFFEVNELYEKHFIPNDPAFPQLYGLKNTDTITAWNETLGDNVIVAVIDTGVDYNHIDIKGNMWQNNGSFGYNFSENNNDPMDYDGHGTHVAGTISAIMNNNTGICGVAPKSKIMAIKIFPNAYPNVITKALKFAVDNGAKIINNSWGPSNRQPSSPTIETAIDYVHSKGGICVFSAGNSNDDTKYYSPANYSKTISVGSTDSLDNRSSFSNYGNVNVYAPGTNILSLENGNNSYSYKSGTSMAAPHVSGAIALLLSKNPNLNFNQIISKLNLNSDYISSTIKRLNSNKLIK